MDNELEPVTIFAGNSATLSLIGHRLTNGTLADLTTGYTCRLRVSGTTVDRVVTVMVADPENAASLNRYFAPVLLPSETALAAGEYIYILDIANAGTNFANTRQGLLTVSAVPAEPATELERLKVHREALLDARDAAVGGSVIEVWNGRYGNKMKYSAMTYAQITDALYANKREIADEELAASNDGRSRRAINLRWAV